MQKALVIAFFLFCFPALSAFPPGTYFFTQENVGGNSGSGGVHFSVYHLDPKTNQLVKGIDGTIPALLHDVAILDDGTNVHIFGINPSSNLVTITQTGPMAFNTTTGNDTVRALTQVNKSIIIVDEKNGIVERDMDGQHIATLASQNWLDPAVYTPIKQIQILSTIPKGHLNIVSTFAVLTDTGQFIVADLPMLFQPNMTHYYVISPYTPRVRFLASDTYAWFLQEGEQPFRYHYLTRTTQRFTARMVSARIAEKQIPLTLDASLFYSLTMRWGKDLVTIDSAANRVTAIDSGFFHPNRLTQMGFQGVLQQTADSMIILPPAGVNCSQYLLSQPTIQPASLSPTVQPNSATPPTKSRSQGPVEISDFEELMQTEAKNNGLRPLDEEVTVAQLADWINRTTTLKYFFRDVPAHRLGAYSLTYQAYGVDPLPGHAQKKIRISGIPRLLSDVQKTKP